MQTLDNLKAAQATSHAAWLSAAKKDKPAAQAALDAACKAVTAAKRAAQVLPPVPTAAEVSAQALAFNAKQAAQRADFAFGRAVQAAQRRRSVAFDWPAHGADWGKTAQDRADQAMLDRAAAQGWTDQHGNDLFSDDD